MIREITEASQIGEKPEVPEWVWIWSWCRYRKSPREFGRFPQQGVFMGEGKIEVLSAERYEQLRLDWLLAGAPRDLSALGSLALHPGNGKEGAA